MKSHKKLSSGKEKWIQGRLYDKGFVCISPQWIKWAKRYMNKQLRRQPIDDLQ